MKIFTIGFTKKTAEQFFTRLQKAGVKRLVDVRLNNTSQLASFAKAKDLEYFLKVIDGIDFIHSPILAPTPDILESYKKKKGPWNDFERGFLKILEQRRIAEVMIGKIRDGDCLLCSEDTPERCHRRLIVEHLKREWGDMEIIHI
jgi:uncharacterized protein (DUF488 family)